MNAIAERAIHRSPETIDAEINEQCAIVAMYHNLAADFYNLDMRPMIFDGTSVIHVGPDPVPTELREQLSEERARLLTLECELQDATRSYITARRSR